MSQTSLTDTQLVILSAAAQREDLRIELPERLRGGAAKAVLSTLLTKALIEHEPDQDAEDFDAEGEAFDQTAYRISLGGLAALGIEENNEQSSALPAAELNLGDAPAGSIEAAPATAIPARATSFRAGTKLAAVVALLEREGGASIDELTAATGWLGHTTRAALTGLRKRGIVVERAKQEDGKSVYRIAAECAGATANEAA